MASLPTPIDVSRFALAGRRADDIYQAIEQAVSTGELAAGEQLPTIRALADRLKANKNTVAAAYKLLLDRGVILTDRRRGSVVASRRPEGLSFPLPLPPSATVVALHDGNPDPVFLPTQLELLTAFSALNLTAPRLYGEARNVPALLDWARAAFAADGLRAESVFVSGGALDAMERALRTYLKPGDKVALEDPGYFTTIALVRSLGLRAVALTSDADGILPESLTAALACGCRAVLFSSRAQNPTGAVTTRLRAQELRPVVAQHPRVLFIDDDHSSLLGLAPYAPWHGDAARWLTVRSFSKFLGPDLRVAVCTGDAATLAQLECSQALSMGWVSTLLQHLVVQLLHIPGVRQRIAAAGVAYQERFTRLRAGLTALGLSVTGRGGLNVWVELPDAVAIAQGLLSKGWLVRSGTDFCLHSPGGIRITSARLPLEQVNLLVADLRELTATTAATSLA